MAASESGLVRRTIWILRTVAAHPEGVGLSEITRESGIPKATCYRVLNVLERESWLVFDLQTRRYRVSLGLLSIVGGLLNSDGAYSHMQDVLHRLVGETQETAGFDVLLDAHVMVLAQVPGPQLIGQILKPVPRTQPVWATSTGRAFLAHMPPDQIRAEFGASFGEAASGEANLELFIDSLADVRERGFAVVHDELEEGASSIAAPVIVKGTTQYAVWIGGPSYRITKDQVDELAKPVVRAAQGLASLLSLTDALPSSFSRSVSNAL